MSLEFPRTFSLLSVLVAGCGAAAPADGVPVSDSTTARDEGAGEGSVDGEVASDAVTDEVAGGLPVGCLLRATSDLNLRAGPSTSDKVLHVIPVGDSVTLLASLPTAGFYNVAHAGTNGWASASFLDTSTCKGGAPDASVDGSSAATIEAIAGASDCAAYAWLDRGKAPKGYVQGVADIFARAVCQPTRSDVVLVSRARTTDETNDALAWYQSIYAGLGMSNDADGVDTLRHAYVLLLGLGMRESSGVHCVGRDLSASFTSSDSAEAGAWQTSYDSHTASAELPKIFAKYRTSDTGCLLPTFSKGLTCSAADWKNWGTGADGLAFQQREKECPAFAGEYAAVMLRVAGGKVGHYGPLRTRAAQVRPECDAMLQKVQALVSTDPTVCASL